MFIYLNKLYISSESRNEILGAEFVKMDKPDSLEFITVHQKHFKDFFEKIESLEKDFSWTDSYDIVMNHEVKNIKIQELYLPEEGTKIPKTVKSLYNLLLDLAEHNCLYSSERIMNSSAKSLPSFRRIRVSNSTMTVGISVLNDESKWRTSQIISVNSDGIINQNSFYCLVPKEKTGEFIDYDLEVVGDIVINNINCVQYRYNKTLPICNSTSSFIIPYPVLVHYSFQSYVYRNVSKVVGVLHSSLLDASHKSDTQDEIKPVRTFTNTNGVFFKLEEKELTKDECIYLVSLAKSMFKASKETGIKLDSHVAHKIVEENKMDQIHYLALVSLFSLMNSGERISLDILDNSLKFMQRYDLMNLYIQLYLYNCRVTCVYNPRFIKISGLNKLYVFGSIYNKALRITLR